MNARPKSKLSPRSFSLIFAGLIALGAARSARASDADPFADTPPGGAPPATVPSTSSVPPAPAAAPAISATSTVPGVVEELPASAYPEPVTRGLYGGPLWLDMQGLQWPYTPRNGIGVSGYGWLDNDYKLTRLGGDPATTPDHNTKLFQQGRFLLRVTPTYTNGSWFVQGQAEIVANKYQLGVQPERGIVGADDVWVRTGVWGKWDVTVGRFQAFDVYPLGMGLDLNTDERVGAYDGTNSEAPQLYNAEYLFNRPAGPGDVALHLYPIPPLRIELLGQWGNNNTLNQVGGRPAVIFDVGWLKLRAAAEYQWSFAQDPSPMAKNDQRQRGVAGSAQIVLAPYVEFGANVGAAVIDIADSNGENLTASGNRLSYGGFVDATPFPGALPNLMLGAGGNVASRHDLFHNPPPAGPYDRSTNTQVFGAAQYLFYRQLFVKLVVAYAKSHFESSTAATYDDDMYSVRLRVMYLF